MRCEKIMKLFQLRFLAWEQSGPLEVLGPVTWFTPAVKSLYVTPSENSPELHSHAHIKKGTWERPPALPRLPSATRICRLSKKCPDGWVDVADVCIPELWIMRRVVKLLRQRLFAGTTLTGGHGAGRISGYPAAGPSVRLLKARDRNKTRWRPNPNGSPRRTCAWWRRVGKKKQGSLHVTSLFNGITRSQLTSCRSEWRALSPRDVGSSSLPYNHFSY